MFLNNQRIRIYIQVTLKNIGVISKILFIQFISQRLNNLYILISSTHFLKCVIQTLKIKLSFNNNK